MQHEDFKDNHEGLAAREFLLRYNELHAANFKLIDKQPNTEPDFYSRDQKTREVLNFDVTLGATRQMIDEWRQLLSKAHREPRLALSLSHKDDFNACRRAIAKKFSMRYGKNCALVVYHFNLCLNAEDFVDDLRRSFDFTVSPFDKGVWLLSTAEFYRIDQFIEGSMNPSLRRHSEHSEESLSL